MSASAEYLTVDSPSGRPLHLRVERLARASGSDPVVVLKHGFKGFMHWGFFPELSRRLAGEGFVCVSYNGSHNGVSASPDDADPAWEEIDDDEAFSRNTHSLEVEDLGLVRRIARELPGVDGAREGLLGHSRGGGIAILSAAASSPQALVTWAAIEDVDRIDDAAKVLWREVGRLEVPNARTGQTHHLDLEVLRDVEANRDALDIRAAARRVESPTLVVHGTDDGAVDVVAAEHLASALPRAERLILEGANHVFGATHPLRAPIHSDLERVFAATLAHLRRHLSE